MNLLALLRRQRAPSLIKGALDYGHQKSDGSHDHRYNKGRDRTPAQKSGDTKRTKVD